MGTPPPYLCEVWKAWLHLGLGLGVQICERYLQNESDRNDTNISTTVALNLVFGKLCLLQGREDEAKAHFEIAVGAFQKWEFTTFPLTHIETLLELKGIYATRRDFDQARVMSEWARRLAETLKSDAGLAMAFQAEAILLSAAGDGKGAGRSLPEIGGVVGESWLAILPCQGASRLLGGNSADEPRRIEEMVTAGCRDLSRN